MAKIGAGAAEGKRTAYINANVLDGTEGMEVLENHAVVVEGRRIVDVAPLADADLSGCETFDLKGAYLLPGLINMHVHLAGNGKPQKKQRDNEALVRKIMSNGLTRAVAYRLVSEYARLELHSGVTTIRTVGGLGDFDTRVRDDAAAGKLEAPRILAANMGISVPGGHMAGSVAIAANSIPEALAQVETARLQGVDLVKLMITGGVLDAKEKGTPGELKMEPDMVRAVCDKAHGLGFIVAAHVESTEGVRVALECGVDSIEHGAAPTDEVMRLFKEGIPSCALRFLLRFRMRCSIAPSLVQARSSSLTAIWSSRALSPMPRRLLNRGFPWRLAMTLGVPGSLSTIFGASCATSRSMLACRARLLFIPQHCAMPSLPASTTSRAQSRWGRKLT